MSEFATIQDVIELWRSLTTEELSRAEKLLPIVSDSLRIEASKVGKDIDELSKNKAYANVSRKPVSFGVYMVRNISCSRRRIVYKK